MAETCCAGGNDVMILVCSGGSNVGQLPNQAAVEQRIHGSQTSVISSATGCGFTCTSC